MTQCQHLQDGRNEKHGRTTSSDSTVMHLIIKVAVSIGLYKTLNVTEIYEGPIKSINHLFTKFKL